ncbi:MAG TPA: acetylxylan esterase, partial [Rariglobus sp.]
PTSIKQAELSYTADRGRWQDRKWTTIPARMENGQVEAAFPDGATACYLNLIDDHDLLVSGELCELAAMTP